MAKKFPILPKYPERTCWGCDRYCPATSMACGNGSVRAQHPVELFGMDWDTWGLDAPAAAEVQPESPTPVSADRSIPVPDPA